MSGMGQSGERDLTAVLIGACVGSMTVLVFTIGILAFIYWCCFRERLRWWRKFENAAVVLGAPAHRPSSSQASNKMVDPNALAGVSTISGSIIQLSNANSIRSYNTGKVHTNEFIGDYGSKPLSGDGSTLERAHTLISALKGSTAGLTNVHAMNKVNVSNLNLTSSGLGDRPLYKANNKAGNGKVRPGVSLAALPTSSQQLYQLQQQQQYLSTKLQQRLQPQPQQVARKTSHQSKMNQQAIRVRGVSVPSDETATSPSEDTTTGGRDSQRSRNQRISPTSTSSSFGATAKRWTSMPAITAFGEMVFREKEKIIQRTSSKRAQSKEPSAEKQEKKQETEELSSSWRIQPQFSQYLPHQPLNSSSTNVSNAGSRRPTASRRQTATIGLPVNNTKLPDVPMSPISVAGDDESSMILETSVKQTEKQQVTMVMMTRDGQYNFTEDEITSPELYRKPTSDSRTMIESPPPSVSAIVGLPRQQQQPATPPDSKQSISHQNSQASSAEYGSHSSRISGDDSAIVVMDSSGSSSKNNTDIEQTLSPQVDQKPAQATAAENTTPPPEQLLVIKSALKKPAPPIPVETNQEAEQSPRPSLENSSEGHGSTSVKVDDDASSSSMRSKIAKIRRYKQRSKTTGASGFSNGGRSQSVADLNKQTKLAPTQPGLLDDERDTSIVQNQHHRLSQRQPVHPRRLTGEITYASVATTITGHAIGVHVDNVTMIKPSAAVAQAGPISPNTAAGMRRYATMEALVSERSDGKGGVFMGRMASMALSTASSGSNSAQNATSTSETSSVKTPSSSRGAPNSSGSSTSSKPQLNTVNVVNNDQNVGVRLTVGGQQQSAKPVITSSGGFRASINNKHPPPPIEPRRSNAITIDQAYYSVAKSPAAQIYSPTSASYNVEQATRQHQQMLSRSNSQRQQGSLLNNTLLFDEDDDDTTTSYSVDQAKRVTENAFRFLSEFSEAETQSIRSIGDESSLADSELQGSLRQQYHRDVHIPSNKHQQLLQLSGRTPRGSPAPQVSSGRQFSKQQQDIRLGDWL